MASTQNETATGEHLEVGAAGWKPFWCSRRVIAAFALIFAGLFAALEVVDSLSSRNNGIATTDMGWYYLWTYGPTAILTVALAFWNRVDYRIRQMAPWITLSREPQVPANRSILLDYVSLTTPEIIYHSIKNRDWVVSISSVIGLLQTALMVISTGLFSLTPVPTTIENVPYKTTTKFALDGTGYSGLSELIAYTYNAVHDLNLSRPIGTTADVAYQQFSPVDTSLPAQAIQQVKVDILMRELDCTPAELQGDGWSMSWLLLGCWSADYGHKLWTTSAFNITIPNCATSPYIFYTPGNDGDVGTFAVIDSLACNDGSYLYEKAIVMVGEARQSGVVGPEPTVESCNLTGVPEARMTVVKSKQWICEPGLKLTKGDVKYNSTATGSGNVPEVSIDKSVPVQNLSRYTFSDFEGALYVQAEAATFKWSSSLPDRSITLWNTRSPAILEAALQRDLQATTDDLLNTDLFLDLFKGYYNEVGVQLMHAGLSRADDTAINGIAIVNRDRLVTQELPLRSMQAILGVLVILSTTCIVASPRKPVVPVDPAPLAGLLSILQENASFAKIFGGTGAQTVATITKALHRMAFTSSLKPDMGIRSNRFLLEKVQVQDLTQQNIHIPNNETKSINWWRPAPMCKRMKIPAFVFVAVIIITLEVLLAVSKKQHGLGNVTIKGNQHLAWSWSSAGVMVVIDLYFQALDASYRSFLPYYRLRKGAPAHSSITANYLRSTAPEVLGLAIRDRQSSVFLMALSAILSMYLTTIVSGAFTPLFVPSHTTVDLAPTSWFVTNGTSDAGTAENNAIISSLIIEGNLSYPRWTYGDLALSSVSILQLSNEDLALQNGSSLQATVPAIRSSLNCSIYDQTQIPGLTYYPQDKSGADKYGIYANMPGPAHCAGSSNDSIQVAALQDMAVGGVVTGVPGPLANETSHNFSGFTRGTQEGCPLLNFFWGLQGPWETQATNVSVPWARALSCYETISQVNAEITFSLPSFAVGEENPPIVDEASARIFSSATVPIPYSSMIGTSDYVSYTNGGGDWFYNAVSNKYHISNSDYGDPDKVDTIVSSLKEAHGIVRAQQYHAALRSNETTPMTSIQKRDTSINLSGTLVDPFRYRLIQNAISTHILVGLLGAMLLCAIVASLLADTKKVLPKDPSSIAAMTSLLADSNMLTEDYISHQQEVEKSNLRRGRYDRHGPWYKLDWFDKGPTEDRVFTIYEFKDDGRLKSVVDEKACETVEHESELQDQTVQDQVTHDFRRHSAEDISPSSDKPEKLAGCSLKKAHSI